MGTTIDDLIKRMDEFAALKAYLLVQIAQNAFLRKGLPFTHDHATNDPQEPDLYLFPLPYPAAFARGLELVLELSASSNEDGGAWASLQMTIVDPGRRSEPMNGDSAHLGISWNGSDDAWQARGIDELSDSRELTPGDADRIRRAVQDMYQTVPREIWGDEDDARSHLSDEQTSSIAIALLEFYLRD